MPLYDAHGKGFVGMQVAGINANPKIPVHAGLAKFLKEHNAWKNRSCGAREFVREHAAEEERVGVVVAVVETRAR
jgi:hypothetical protein